MNAIGARLCAGAVTCLARLITGVRGNWQGCLPEPRTRIYFANHRSHGDFVLIWTVLPAALRRRTRPVAAADYWGRGGLRELIGRRVFDALLVARDGASRERDPIVPLAEALDAGASLILFPEGTRNRPKHRSCRSRAGSTASPAPARRSSWCRCGSTI